MHFPKHRGERGYTKLLIRADVSGFYVLYMRSVCFALGHTSRERKHRGKQHMCIKCDGIQSTALHHPPLKWPLKRRTSQRWDQAVSGLADLHDLESELQEIRFLASLENQIKLQQLQLNGRFASSAEQGRPVSSTVWVPLGVVCAVLELCASTASTLHWMFLSGIWSTSSSFSLGTTDSWFYLHPSVTRAKNQSVELFPDVKVIEQAAYCSNH